MKQVVVFPRGQLSVEDKALLAEADIIAVEADDPRAVVTVLPISSIATGDDILLSALDGVLDGNQPKSTMAISLAKRIIKRAEAQGQKQ